MTYIRPATPEDAPQIAKIHVEVWQSHYRGQVPDDYLDSLSIEKKTRFWTDRLSNPDSKSRLFIAEENNIALGWCEVGPTRDEGELPATGELYTIYVDVSAQGKGVGKDLMKIGLDFLHKEGFRGATLWVLRTNVSAIKFYEANGWKADGAEKKVPKNDFVFDEIRYRIDL